MKNTVKRIMTILLLTVMAVGIASLWARLGYLHTLSDRPNFSILNSWEGLACLLSAVFWIICYSKVCNVLIGQWLRNVGAIITGVLFVGEILILSNYVRYLSWVTNITKKHDFKLYLEYIWYDLKDGVRFGKYAYLIMFVVIVGICLVIAYYERFLLWLELKKRVKVSKILESEECFEESLISRYERNLLYYMLEQKEEREPFLPEIETNRLCLRPAKDEDAKALSTFYATAEVVYPLGWFEGVENPKDVAELQIDTWYEEYSCGVCTNWVIARKEDDEAVGIIQYKNFKKHKCAEISFFIGKQYWRQGYMKEALKAVVRFSFETLQLHKIVAKTLSDNEACKELLLNSGWKHEGTFEDDYFRGGRYCDICYFAIVNSEE